MSQQQDWIVIELRSSNDNLIHELAAALYSEQFLQHKLIELQIDFSIIGIGVRLSSRKLEISSDETAVKKMLETAELLGRKVLIAIDEISSTPSMREFCSLFNVCKGEGYPIYLIMDGLFRNMNNLENVNDLTFLKRVPHLSVGSLDILSMIQSYRQFLQLDGNKEPYAVKLARLTKGYPYAFQLVGYYSWLMLHKDPDAILKYDEFESSLCGELDRNLSEYVYRTLWAELSPTEQRILSVMSVYALRKVGSIRKKYNEIFTESAPMTSSNFSKYRDALIRTQVLMSPANTMLDFCLPRFDLYAAACRDERIL